MAGVPTIDTGPMTVEDFYLLTESRPDNEKWELIDGVPMMNASPSRPHQVIVGNVIVALGMHARQNNVAWRVIPGIGARISDICRPEPDVMVLPAVTTDPSSRDTRDAIVLFEVMSPSTAQRDLQWKRAAYISLPALQDYVVIAQNRIDVVTFSQRNDFTEARLRSAQDILQLPTLGVDLPLLEIYRDTVLLDHEDSRLS
jgi:Uma2 family endonuclease